MLQDIVSNAGNLHLKYNPEYWVPHLPGFGSQLPSWSWKAAFALTTALLWKQGPLTRLTSLFPTQIIQSLLMTVANNFVTDKNSGEVMTVGYVEHAWDCGCV